jgi:hypothetical protein
MLDVNKRRSERERGSASTGDRLTASTPRLTALPYSLDDP